MNTFDDIKPKARIRGLTAGGFVQVINIERIGDGAVKVVYEDEDLYRNQDGRDVILLHPDDLSLLSLKHNQRVIVNSKTGTMANIRVRSYENIRQGNALMYYPEANVLVSRDSDPTSRTPAFKGVVVTITPET